MPGKRSFPVGQEVFATKKAFIERLRAILNTWNLGAHIAGEDDVLLRAAIVLHPEAEGKIGAGVAHFEVRLNLWRDRIKQRGLWIVRLDGSEIDFSIYMCDPSWANPERMRRYHLNEAAREAVQESVFAYKSARFAEAAICEVTGRALTWAEAHVDHDDPWPFRRILSEWEAGQNGQEVAFRDDGMTFAFRDQDMRAAFRRFHDDRAVLKLVHRDVNLCKPRCA